MLVIERPEILGKFVRADIEIQLKLLPEEALDDALDECILDSIEDDEVTSRGIFKYRGYVVGFY